MTERPKQLKIIKDEPIEVIDLSTPTTMTAMKDMIDRRKKILACYPTTSNDENAIEPLFVNVPPERLTAVELRRRQSGTYPLAVRLIEQNPTMPSLLRDKYHQYFDELKKNLKVDLSILDYNYTRLNRFLRLFMYQQVRVFNLQAEDAAVIEEKEFPCLLEFFMQFDPHLFYMKTCSFRFARPRTLQEGLFCLSEPEARYDLTACGNCAICCPKYSMKYRAQPSIIDFSPGHRHRFVNGYEVILNGSASCHTRNIIYALTCPCGQVNYVGATAQSLHDRLKNHREHGNRIMHEFLLGPINILRDTPRMKTSEIIRKDRMKLYQHSARCPVAMQIFLDANPQYWRFIPMTNEESLEPKQKFIQRPVLSDEINSNYRSKEDALACVDALLAPPLGFVFSNRQLVLQTQYFHQKRDKTLPDMNIDLYRATIIALLPDGCSDMFRYTVESLFITHAESSLNSFGNVLIEEPSLNENPLHNPWLVRGDTWCQGLLRRPQPK